MAAATTTTHDAIIKEIWPEQGEILKAMYENNTLFAMLKKDFKGYGKKWHLPMRIAHTAGRSHVMQNAKANKKGSAVVEFQVTTAKNYSLYSVDGELQRKTANDKGALVDAFEYELESAFDAIKRNFGWEVYANGGGAIGQIATAGISSATITLANANDIIKISKNMVLNLSTADGTSGSLRAGTLIVDTVDRDAGTFTCTQNITTGIPGAAAADYIFQDGDFGQGIKGLNAWIPSTAPTAGDSFFGLDRSQDTFLSGNRVTGTSLSHEEALQKACQVATRNGGKLTHFFLNDLDFLNLDLSLGARRMYCDTKTDVGVGFSGVKVATGYGFVECYADYNCPQGVAYGLELDKWSLRGPGEWPFIEARDGDKLIREDSSDSFEGRVIAYYQMQTKKTNGQVRLTLPT